jgi:hypothetical protein
VKVLIAIVIAIVLLAGCMFVMDSHLEDSNIFKENVSGTKDTGIDFAADCNQQIGDKCTEKE